MGSWVRLVEVELWHGQLAVGWSMLFVAVMCLVVCLLRWLAVGCTLEVDLLAVVEVLAQRFPMVQFVVDSVESGERQLVEQ